MSEQGFPRHPVTVERVAAAEEIVSVLRHDLRNKLGAIRNAAFYIGRRLQKTDMLQQDPRVPTFLKLIEEELDRADGLLRAHDKFVHLYERRPQSVRIGDCTKEAVDSRTNAEGIQVECVFEDTVSLSVDVSEVIVIVWCLLDNAQEAVAPGGRIRVHTIDGEGAAVLRIWNSGAKPSEEAQLRAFEPLFTTKPGRAGLGLPMARRLTRYYRGDIELGWDEQGTTATVRIPQISAQGEE